MAGPGCFGTDSTIAVPDPVTISSIAVYINAAIPSSALLQLSLKSPGGQYVMLLDGSAPIGYCGIVGQVTGAFPTSMQPQESLMPLVGTDAQGEWTLHLYDASGTGNERLDGWALYIE